MSKNTNYKCRQCGSFSTEITRILHKPDCSYSYEIQSLVNEMVDAIDHQMPLEYFPARLDRFVEKVKR